MGGIMMNFQRVALIGFGEVGQIFARDLRAAGVSHLAAFDIEFENPDSLQTKAARAQEITVCASAGEAAAQADLVISSVTAGSALIAAESVVGHLRHSPFFLDVNSVSPSTKQAASMVVERAGGRYVEAAVMTNVPPHGIRSPMLLGGPHAETFITHAAPWDIRLTAFSPEVGRASSVKMCRSVMIKGLEALTTECMLAAHHYGVVKLEALGCEDSVVGLVIPTGYSFNLDGTCLYLASAAIFLAQATNTPLDIWQQLGLLGVLLLTSKGAAGVAGAAFVVLAATLASVGTIPVASVALILGIHRLMSEGLTPTNLIGNAVATIVIAKWEGALDQAQLQRTLNGEPALPVPAQ